MKINLIFETPNFWCQFFDSIYLQHKYNNNFNFFFSFVQYFDDFHASNCNWIVWSELQEINKNE